MSSKHPLLDRTRRVGFDVKVRHLVALDNAKWILQERRRCQVSKNAIVGEALEMFFKHHRIAVPSEADLEH